MANHISVEHVPAAQDDYEIKVMVDALSDGGYAITGVGLDPRGKAIEKTKRVRKASSKAKITDTKRFVTNLVNAALVTNVAKSQKRNTSDSLDETNPYVIACRRVMESEHPINPKWNNETRQTALTYFSRHTLPFLSKLEDVEFLSSDREALKQEIFKNISGNARSGGVDRQMRQTVQKHLDEADAIYAAMRQEDPSLPAIVFSEGKRKARIQTETIKSLPRAVRRRFVRELEKRITKEPQMVFGAVLMWDGGLRTGEAAAVIYEIDIRNIDEIYVVEVEWQEKSGLRSAILKTKNAYRMVPLSYWGITMLQRCMAEMPSSTEGEKNPSYAPLRKRDLSAWVRSVLTECGCDETFWDVLHGEEQRNPDRDDEGNPIYDLSAYVLRRDRCGIWRNVCGLTQLECDYYLGHVIKLSQRKRNDMRTTESLSKTGKKLERFVYDPLVSRNPYYNPIELKHGEDVESIPFEATRIVNHTGTTLQVSLEASAEIVGKPIILILPANAQIKNMRRRSSRTLDRRPDKPIIGTGQEGFPNEQYENRRGLVESPGM